jgi:hypothetical protein
MYRGRGRVTQASNPNLIGRALTEIRPLDVCRVCCRKGHVRRKVGVARRRHSTTNQLYGRLEGGRIGHGRL